ncbi:MAG: hypothetical protein IJM54_08765 [Thermoguttaceae bacterium]|nr:hypothetical protein [Thermoguttaceae bacterium]
MIKTSNSNNRMLLKQKSTALFRLFGFYLSCGEPDLSESKDALASLSVATDKALYKPWRSFLA